MKTAFFSFGFLIVLGYPLLIIGAIYLLLITRDLARLARRPKASKSP